MNPTDAPRPTGNVRELDLVGHLFAVHDSVHLGSDVQAIVPVLMTLTNEVRVALPLFSLEDRLRAMMAVIGVGHFAVKKVSGPEFLESLPREWLLIVDPWVTPTGTVKYFEVARGN